MRSSSRQIGFREELFSERVEAAPRQDCRLQDQARHVVDHAGYDGGAGAMLQRAQHGSRVGERAAVRMDVQEPVLQGDERIVRTIGGIDLERLERQQHGGETGPPRVMRSTEEGADDPAQFRQHRGHGSDLLRGSDGCDALAGGLDGSVGQKIRREFRLVREGAAYLCEVGIPRERGDVARAAR